jgi:hypothetical protein
MAEMGRYCKAYPINRFREFKGWTEKSENARKEKQEVAGREVDEPRPLTDDSFLYLQENYVVTDGIAKDENIIYDDITPEWKEFCTEQLKFAVPAYELQNDEL